VKSSRSETLNHAHKIPEIQFETEGANSLTSFSGLVIFQALFQRLNVKGQLRKCLGHLRPGAIYRPNVIALWLIVHLILGFRKLRDRDFYCDDPMVCRVLGVRRLPDVATISRTFASMDEQAIVQLRNMATLMVCQRLIQEKLARVTLDFDGSVFSTRRHANGTAIGFNKKKKGARSYYPLFCTVAQTGQFLDLHHRPGNVHDSNGSREFIRGCFAVVREHLALAVLESRLDSAFFSEELVEELSTAAEFTISVPFERLTELKKIIENRQRWRVLDDDSSYFELSWKPKSWSHKCRFVFVRQKKKQPVKGVLQLDLFEPRSFEYEFKVIVTNKTVSAKSVVAFHEGRGSQEAIFGEAKSHCQMEYVPVKGLHGNQFYCLAAVMAHNLTREMQIESKSRVRATTDKRTHLWAFETLRTLRERLIRRAGRLIRPQGRLTLVMSANAATQEELQDYLAI
jgi:hypothetical protein